jgi:hypothetical protein
MGYILTHQSSLKDCQANLARLDDIVTLLSGADAAEHLVFVALSAVGGVWYGDWGWSREAKCREGNDEDE